MARAILVRHGRTTANVSGVLAGRGDAELDEHGTEQARRLGEYLRPIALELALVSPMLRTRQTANFALDGQTVEALDEWGVAEVDYGEWTGGSLKTLAKEPLWTLVQSHPSAVTFPGGESMAGMATRAVTAVRAACARLDELRAAADEMRAADAGTAGESTPADVSPASPDDGTDGSGEFPGIEVQNESTAYPTNGDKSGEAPQAGMQGGRESPETGAKDNGDEPPVRAQQPPPNLLVVTHGDIIKAILADALGMHLDAFQRICVDPGSVSVVRYQDGRPFVECTNTDGSQLARTLGVEVTTEAVLGGGSGR